MRRPQFLPVHRSTQVQRSLRHRFGGRLSFHGRSQSCATQHATLNLSIVKGLVLPLFCGWLHHNNCFSCLSLSVPLYFMSAAREFASAGRLGWSTTRPTSVLKQWTRPAGHGHCTQPGRRRLLGTDYFGEKRRTSKESRASLWMTPFAQLRGQIGCEVSPATTISCETSSILMQKSGRNFLHVVTSHEPVSKSFVVTSHGFGKKELLQVRLQTQSVAASC